MNVQTTVVGEFHSSLIANVERKSTKHIGHIVTWKIEYFCQNSRTTFPLIFLLKDMMITGKCRFIIVGGDQFCNAV